MKIKTTTLSPSTKRAFCTASLITNNLILTSHHCVPGKGNVVQVLLTMGFLNSRTRKGVAQYRVNPKPVEASKDLDYAILRVEGNPGTEWGTIKLSIGTPDALTTLFVVHHPGGYPKYVTRGRCQTSDPAVDGSDLLHTCDTVPGSSGAPIFDNNTRKVVALHWGAVGLKKLNAGKRIASIAAHSKIIRRLLWPRLLRLPTPVAPPSPVPRASLAPSPALPNSAAPVDFMPSLPEPNALRRENLRQVREANKLLSRRANKGNIKRALQLYLEAAKNGNVDALGNLGALYAQGKLVRRNTTKAIRMLMRAMKGGNYIAAIHMALYVDRGIIKKRGLSSSELLIEALRMGRGAALAIVLRMKKMMSRKSIMDLQRRLKSLGYLDTKVTGAIEKGTIDAMMRIYQPK